MDVTMTAVVFRRVGQDRDVVELGKPKSVVDVCLDRLRIDD